MREENFFADLKRRNVYKVAIAYAVVGWLLIQAASILFPTFEAPFVYQQLRPKWDSHLEGRTPATPNNEGLAGARPSIAAKSIAVPPLDNPRVSR